MDYVQLRLFLTPNSEMTDAAVKADMYQGDPGINDWVLVRSYEYTDFADMAADLDTDLDAEFANNIG